MTRELKVSTEFAAKFQAISKRRGWTKEEHDEMVDVLVTALRSGMEHGGKVAADEAIRILKEPTQ